jgi:hypothetical protein
MLPDLRFLLGAALAIALLAVAGVGLIASTRLLHEARIAPIEERRSLAYAGRPNQRDDGGLPALISDGPPAPTRPMAAPIAPPPVEALPDPPQAETPDEPPAEPARTSPPAAELPARVALAPAQSAPDGPDDQKTEQQAPADTAPDVAPVAPVPAKPYKRHRVARLRFPRIFTQTSQQTSQPTWPQTYQQTWQQTYQQPWQGFPASNNAYSPWPGFDTQFGQTSTARKVAGKSGNRP